MQQRIKSLKDKFKKEICAKLPNAFWQRKKHIVELTYKPDFKKSHISTKARPIHLNERHLKLKKKKLKIFLERS